MSFRSLALRLISLPAALVCLLVVPARSETIWYVNANATGAQTGLDWANAFKSPDLALAAASATFDAAGNSDQIWVTEGIYRPPVVFAAGVFVSNWFVVNKPVRLYGGFKGTETSVSHRSGSFKRTILDGDIGTLNVYTDNSLHVVSVANVPGVNGNPGVLIDGFQIRNGYATGVGMDGAGILCKVSDLDLVNCFVRTNYAAPSSNFGGGLYFTSINGGIEPTIGYRLRIKDCEFEGNHGQAGGAIFGDCLRGEVVNTRIFDSQSGGNGAGVYLCRMGTESSLDFTNCVFWDNFCASGGAATQGGALYLDTYFGTGSGGRAKLVNCTLAGNMADGNPQVDGQAIGVGATSYATVYNSILFWNGSNGLGNHMPINGPATVEYSDLEGGWPVPGSPGNKNVDPLFVSLGTGNLTLQLTPQPSLCIDAADYGRLPADTMDVDHDGNVTEIIPLDLLLQTRIIDQTSVADTGVGSTAFPSYTYLDMGAYERP